MAESNRQKCRRITDEVAEAIAAIAEREGLTLKRERSSYTAGGTVTVKFTFESKADKAKKAEYASMDAELLGLPADVIGREFTCNGNMYVVTGLKLSRPKYPVEAERVSNGKGYKFPEDVVKAALAREASDARP